MQTVKDFVCNPVSGLAPIDETVLPIPDYQVLGTSPPVAQLAFVPTMSEIAGIPVPMWMLWRRSKTVLKR